MKKMSIITLVVALSVCVLSVGSAEAFIGVSLQIHNPAGGPPSNPEPADVKSQFVVRNDSDPGISITSILWDFSTANDSVFVDSTAAAPGVGGFRDYEISPAQTYSGPFNISVLANSHLIVGAPAPTAGVDFANGATSISLSFSDFGSGEAFAFWTDIDSDAQGRVGNSNFDGSKTTITFSDNTVIDFEWDLPNNSGRSFFAQIQDNGNTVIPEPTSMLLFGSGMLGAFIRRKIKA